MNKHCRNIVIFCLGIFIFVSCNSGGDSTNGSGGQTFTLTVKFTNVPAGYTSSSKSLIQISENRGGGLYVQTAGINESMTITGSTYTSTAKEYQLSGSVYTTAVKQFAAGTSVRFSNIFLDKNGNGIAETGEVNDGTHLTETVLDADKTVTFDCSTLHIL